MENWTREQTLEIRDALQNTDCDIFGILDAWDRQIAFWATKLPPSPSTAFSFQDEKDSIAEINAVISAAKGSGKEEWTNSSAFAIADAPSYKSTTQIVRRLLKRSARDDKERDRIFKSLMKTMDWIASCISFDHYKPMEAFDDLLDNDYPYFERGIRLNATRNLAEVCARFVTPMTPDRPLELHLLAERFCSRGGHLAILSRLYSQPQCAVSSLWALGRMVHRLSPLLPVNPATGHYLRLFTEAMQDLIVPVPVAAEMMFLDEPDLIDLIEYVRVAADRSLSQSFPVKASFTLQLMQHCLKAADLKRVIFGVAYLGTTKELPVDAITAWCAEKNIISQLFGLPDAIIKSSVPLLKRIAGRNCITHEHMTLMWDRCFSGDCDVAVVEIVEEVLRDFPWPDLLSRTERGMRSDKRSDVAAAYQILSVLNGARDLAPALAEHQSTIILTCLEHLRSSSLCTFPLRLFAVAPELRETCMQEIISSVVFLLQENICGDPAQLCELLPSVLDSPLILPHLDLIFSCLVQFSTVSGREAQEDTSAAVGAAKLLSSLANDLQNGDVPEAIETTFRASFPRLIPLLMRNAFVCDERAIRIFQQGEQEQALIEKDQENLADFDSSPLRKASSEALTALLGVDRLLFPQVQATAVKLFLSDEWQDRESAIFSLACCQAGCVYDTALAMLARVQQLIADPHPLVRRSCLHFFMQTCSSHKQIEALWTPCLQALLNRLPLERNVRMHEENYDTLAYLCRKSLCCRKALLPFLEEVLACDPDTLTRLQPRTLQAYSRALENVYTAMASAISASKSMELVTTLLACAQRSPEELTVHSSLATIYCRSASEIPLPLTQQIFSFFMSALESVPGPDTVFLDVIRTALQHHGKTLLENESKVAGLVMRSALQALQDEESVAKHLQVLHVLVPLSFFSVSRLLHRIIQLTRDNNETNSLAWGLMTLCRLARCGANLYHYLPTIMSLFNEMLVDLEEEIAPIAKAFCDLCQRHPDGVAKQITEAPATLNLFLDAAINTVSASRVHRYAMAIFLLSQYIPAPVATALQAMSDKWGEDHASFVQLTDRLLELRETDLAKKTS